MIHTQKGMHSRKFGITAIVLAGSMLLVSIGAATAGRAVRVNNAIWAHDRLFDTVLTDTAFKNPPPHSTDVLFNFMASGLDGQRSVAETAPGDRGYNGGRWAVKAVVFTELGVSVHDPDGDGFVNFELTNAEDVLTHAMLGHLVIHDTDVYFECPMLR